MIPNGVIGVSEVKNSIFQLWSGIVLGWVKWPKNALKRLKNWLFWFLDDPTVYPGLPPGYPVGHQNRILALIPSFIEYERAGKGVFAPAWIPDTLQILE